MERRCDTCHFSGSRLCTSPMLCDGSSQWQPRESDPTGRAASDSGVKHDTGKQQWHRMPLCVLKPLADVYCIAGKEYEAFNCLKPFEDADARFWDATMRHLEACQLDPLAKNEEQGGVYHAAQVAFNILHRLHDAIEREKGR